MPTHIALCSYLLFPNFSLCMLLFRLPLKFCALSIRLESANIYSFEVYFMCWVYEGYKGMKNTVSPPWGSHNLMVGAGGAQRLIHN